MVSKASQGNEAPFIGKIVIKMKTPVDDYTKQMALLQCMSVNLSLLELNSKERRQNPHLPCSGQHRQTFCLKIVGQQKGTSRTIFVLKL